MILEAESTSCGTTGGATHSKLLADFNPRDPEELERGHAMLEEVKRLRKDRAAFEDVIGWRGRRTPITAVVADLADSRDPGLKKAMARIKRAMPKRLLSTQERDLAQEADAR